MFTGSNWSDPINGNSLGNGTPPHKLRREERRGESGKERCHAPDSPCIIAWVGGSRCKIWLAC